MFFLVLFFFFVNVQVFEGLPEAFCEDQDTVVRYMKLLPPVFSDEDRRGEAAAVSE